MPGINSSYYNSDSFTGNKLVNKGSTVRVLRDGSIANSTVYEYVEKFDISKDGVPPLEYRDNYPWIDGWTWMGFNYPAYAGTEPGSGTPLTVPGAPTMPVEIRPGGEMIYADFGLMKKEVYDAALTSTSEARVNVKMAVRWAVTQSTPPQTVSDDAENSLGYMPMEYRLTEFLPEDVSSFEELQKNYYFVARFFYL